MFVKVKVLCAFLLCAGLASAQKDKVLLKIDGEPVYASEFKRLFGKNKNLKLAEEKPAIEDDIQLFIDYKLKLIEAKELQMDTVPSYQKEVVKYREQLVQPYLNDDSLIDSLAEEAYQRSLKEVRASHILIQIPKGSNDTLAAYNKIKALRAKIIAGASFNAIAKANSEDPSAKKNAGDLGYFSVFRMVYPFESAAFNTEKGKVSEIFRSQFGYHILKVTDERKSQGEQEVAHIMVRDTSAAGNANIQKVYKEIIAGGDFATLAKKYSDDRRSSVNGGKLKKFTLGSMPVPFGEISFSLSEENRYSKPFRTAYGWHIVKFIKHYPVPAFDEVKEELVRKTKSDSRSKTLSNPVVLKLKKQYKIAVNDKAKEAFKDPKFVANDSINDWLVVIENDTLTQKDFGKYISNRRHKAPLQNFDPYLDAEILNYYKAHLEETDEDFKYLFEEYKNGLLLFDLMKEKIWDAAQNDTLGLENYYQKNKLTYVMPDKYKAVVVSTKNVASEAAIVKILQASDSIKAMEEQLAVLEGVLVKSGEFEKDAAVFPKMESYQVGEVFKTTENGYQIAVKIIEKTPSYQQEFEEVKGRVISDFQNEVQDNWLASLREKHKVKTYKRSIRKTAAEMEIYNE